MGNFFAEGGWVMWPVLIIGLVFCTASAKYGWDGERLRLRFIGAVGALLTAAMIHGLLTNVAMVFWYLESEERAPGNVLVRTLFTGLKESSRPVSMGGALLVLGLLGVAIGSYREQQRELRART